MGSRMQRRSIISLALVLALLLGLILPVVFNDMVYADEPANAVEGFYLLEGGNETRISGNLELGADSYGKEFTVKVKYNEGVDFSHYMLEVQNPADLNNQVLQKISENKEEQTITFKALQKGESAILVRAGIQDVLAEQKVVVSGEAQTVTNIELQRFKHGDGVGITDKWVSFVYPHVFKWDQWEKISDGSIYKLRAVVTGSNDPVQWIVNQDTEAIQRVLYPDEKEFWFSVKGKGNVRITAKCGDKEDWVEFDTEYGKDLDELKASWKEGKDGYDSGDYPDIEVASSGLNLKVGDEICLMLHGKDQSGLRLGEHPLRKYVWDIKYEGANDLFKVEKGKDGYYKRPRDYLFNITALKPGKTIAKFTGSYSGSNYSISIPIEIKAESGGSQSPADKIKFAGFNTTGKADQFNEIKDNAKGDLYLGQFAYIKAELKDGEQGELSVRPEQESQQNITVSPEGDNIFKIGFNKTGKFNINICLGEETVRSVELNVKENISPSIWRHNVDTSKNPWLLIRSGRKSYQNGSTIEEELNVNAAFKPDVKEISSQLKYNIEVTDPAGALQIVRKTDEELHYTTLKDGEVKIDVSCISGKSSFILKVGNGKENIIEKIGYHKRGKNYNNFSQSLDGEVDLVTGQLLFLKPIVKEGSAKKAIIKAKSGYEDKLAVADKGNGVFSVKAKDTGRLILEATVDGLTEREIVINAKKQEPIVKRHNISWIQHGPQWFWSVIMNPNVRYDKDNNIIVERIGNRVCLRPDVEGLKEFLPFTFEVTDPDGVIDTTPVTSTCAEKYELEFTVVGTGDAKIKVKCEGGEQEYIIRVVKVPAEGVVITNAPNVLEPDAPVTLKAVVTPGNATDRVNWSVDDSEVADIDQSGTLTPKKEGVVKVTAEANGIKDEAVITIRKIKDTDFYFQDAKTKEKKYVENGEIELMVTDFGHFFMEGEQNNSVQVKDWHSEEYVHHPQSDEYSFWFWIDQDNRFHPRKVGEQKATLTYLRDGNVFEKEFTLKVISGDVEEIRAYAMRDGQRFDLGGDNPLPVEGSERVKVFVEGKRKGKTDFELIPDTSYELVYKNKQHIIGSSFALWSPETHVVDIRMLDDSCKLSFKATSSYVPQTGFEGDVPARWPIHDWNNLGYKFVGMRYHPMEEVEEWGSSGYTLRTLPHNASYHVINWESLNPEIAEYDPLHANGFVPKKPGKAKFVASLPEDSSVRREFEVEFYYLNPLTKASSVDKVIEITQGEQKALKLSIKPKFASEQRFNWSCSGKGAVEIFDTVHVDPNDVNVEKWTVHNIKGIRPGRTEVIGIPYDETGDIEKKTVRFTVMVKTAEGYVPEDDPIEPGNGIQDEKTLPDGNSSKITEGVSPASGSGDTTNPNTNPAVTRSNPVQNTRLNPVQNIRRNVQNDTRSLPAGGSSTTSVNGNSVPRANNEAEAQDKTENSPSYVSTPNKLYKDLGEYTYGGSPSEEATFRIKGIHLSDLVTVFMDGKELDPKYYEAREGSLIVTLKKSYVDELSSGEHDLRIETKEGDVKVLLNVAKEKSLVPAQPRGKAMGVLAALVIGLCIIALLYKKGIIFKGTK